MPYPLPLTRTEAYLAYKAGVIQQSDLKPSLAVPRNGIDAWLAYWTGLTTDYPVKNVGKNLFNTDTETLVFIDSSGNIIAGLVWSCSDYIKVSPNTTYTWHGEHTGSLGGQVIWAGYDSSKVFISGQYAQVNNTTSTSFTTGASTEYVRVGYRNDRLENMQLELGSTATAYEPYTGEPLILQEEEAYIAYLSGVISEYPEKCLRRVGAYLRYLISARWGRPDHPLNREELYLSLIKTQVIPSGDPSSDIVIEGSTKAPFQDVKMYGDTFQQSYTGKNLYEWGDVAFSSSTDNISWCFQDGAKGAYGANITSKTTYKFTLPAGTYYLSAYDVSSNVVRINLCTDGDSAERIIISPDDSFDLSKETVVVIRYRVTNPSLGIGNTKLQLESGSTATSYEPYTGGQPSPNPEYPQPIQTVTGLQTVEIQGKNLLRYPYTGGTVGTGLTWTVADDGTVHVVGAIGGGNKSYYLYNRSQSDYDMPEIPAGTYKVFWGITGSGSSPRITIQDTNGYHNSNASNEVTIATSAKPTAIYIQFTSSQSGDVDLYLKPMIVPSDQADAYEPYSSNDYEINLGKNLFNPSLDPTYVSPHQSLVKSETGVTITAALKNSGKTWSEFVEYTYSLDPHTTYTLSKKSRLIGGAQYRYSGALRVHHINSGTYSPTTDSDTITFTTDGTGKVGILFYLSYMDTTQGDVSTTVEFYDVQLEAGGSQTPFAPYFEPIELCKLGAYQDYIWKDGENWKVHKATASDRMASTDNWVIPNPTNYPNLFQAVINRLDLAPEYVLNSSALEALCNELTYMDSGAVRTVQGFAVYNNEGSKLVRINIADFTTVAQLKEWLSSNDVEILFALATPTDTVITNANLIAQLEALVVGGAENGTTYIKVNATGPNLPGLLYVEAPKYD